MNKEAILRNLTSYVHIEVLTKKEHYHAIRSIPHSDFVFNSTPRLLIAQNLLYVNNKVKKFSIGADHFSDRHCNRVFLNAGMSLTKTKHLYTDGRYIILCQHNTAGKNYGYALQNNPTPPYNPTTHTNTKQLFYLATELDWTELCRHPQKYDYKDLKTELDRAKYGFFRTTPLLPPRNRPKILQ